MRLLFCKACEYATQLENGRHCLIGMFENISCPYFPVTHPPFFLCLQVEFELLDLVEKFDITAHLIDEDGQPVADFSAAGEVPPYQGGVTRLHMVFHIMPIEFQKPGDYRIDVTLNDKKIGEERLPVILIPQEDLPPIEEA